jgi:hypothetical protein
MGIEISTLTPPKGLFPSKAAYEGAFGDDDPKLFPVILKKLLHLVMKYSQQQGVKLHNL